MRTCPIHGSTTSEDMKGKRSLGEGKPEVEVVRRFRCTVPLIIMGVEEFRQPVTSQE